MIAVVEIDLNSPQARKFIGYTRTLPFAKVKRQKTEKAKSEWDEALAEGAVSVGEFFDEVRRRINEHYDSRA